MCQDEVGTIYHGKRPLNIVIIGVPGCGKSSLLNTIFASFSDERWKPIALQGNYGKLGKQFTQSLISYKKERYYTRKGRIRKDDGVLMPTFIDMSGFEDINNGLNRELLNTVLYEKLHEYEKFKDVYECFNNSGKDGVRRKYGERNEYLVVDRIILVCSGDPIVPLPINLMECVSQISNAVRCIPVFGVMTKADKFDGSQNAIIDERERLFMEHLGIEAERFKRIKNYCADIDKDTTYRFSLTPEIDIDVLQLMHQVFSNSLRVSNPEGRLDYSVQTERFVDGSRDAANQVPRRNNLPKSYSGLNVPRLFLLIKIQVLLMGMTLQSGIKPTWAMMFVIIVIPVVFYYVFS
ncbi:uncharacterized protein LOC127702640 [Mytilus californianus]|uniref:uncharacterized protein LOC127702640 n=1 Tax=Mytilus californianus TaxID=6549 RepID=UPI002247BDAB|nr:uncharacterized protein LOC127702640 [Mytilus californianus]XP_052062884.1 uncharacterized protein LOC127702640 [Mytilus californianus]